MKEKMRHVLGFLGLVEDEYGEYASSAPARPFSEQPLYDETPEPYQTPANQSRPFPTTPGTYSAPRPTPLAPRTSSISVIDANGPGSRVRPMTSSGLRGIAPLSMERDLAIFIPTSYHESSRITDLLRANRAVVMNVSDVDPGVARRLVDFAAGTAYALGAKIERLADGSVYLVSPPGSHVSVEVRERLRASNYRSTGNE